jgi:flagellar basal-body rod modification protein FlgD
MSFGSNSSSFGGSSVSSSFKSLQTAASPQTETQKSLDKNRATIANNFDQFLSLLTTQLKNQSPLDPLDANQFTQQLVQFSSVEQQLKTNDILASMSAKLESNGNGNGTNTMNAAQAASLIGTRASVDASKTRPTPVYAAAPANETAAQRTERLSQPLRFETSWPVTVQSNYGNYNATVTNSKGEVIFSREWAPGGTGEQTFTWTGTSTTNVNFDPDETYTLQVDGALRKSDGTYYSNRSKMQIQTSGSVTAVDMSGTEPMVEMTTAPGVTQSYLLSAIKKVSK